MNLMSVREFEKRLEYFFLNFTIEDYKKYISVMAGETAPSERTMFIERLESVLNKKNAINTKSSGKDVRNATQSITLDERVAKLLDKINALEEAFSKLIEGYENGEFGYDEYHDTYYDDDVSISELSEFDELRGEGNNILLDTRDLFAEGYYKEAREVYAGMMQFLEEGNVSYGLFSLFEDESEMAYNEEICRFIRCIYLTEPMESRPVSMYELFKNTSFICEHINLKIVIQSSNEELPDLYNFLVFWKSYLLKQEVTDNTSFLIREASEMHGGIEEIKELALSHGNLYQEAYCDWAMMLRNENEDITDTCLYALERVTEKKIGLKLCSYLAEQAEKNNDIPNCLAAWEKAFYYDHTLIHLLDMLKYAKMLQCQADKLKQALKQIKKTTDYDKNVEIHILIFLGDLQKAYAICSGGKSLGWSYGAVHIPVLIGFFMKLLSVGKNKKLKHIDGFWHSYTSIINTHPEYKKCVDDAIETAKITEKDKETYYKWCVKMCCDRIDGIVSGQYRNAYDRAAQTLAACEELRTNICGPDAGESLVAHYLNKYPRHSSFKSSVRSILNLKGR